MRVIEEKMLNAILNGKDFHGANTRVEKCDNGVMRVYLFSHCIAKIDLDNKRLLINNCGWCSNTTRSRLNVILTHFTHKWIKQKDWTWYMYSLIDTTKSKYPFNWKAEEYSQYNNVWIDFEK